MGDCTYCGKAAGFPAAQARRLRVRARTKAWRGCAPSQPRPRPPRTSTRDALRERLAAIAAGCWASDADVNTAIAVPRRHRRDARRSDGQAAELRHRRWLVRLQPGDEPRQTVIEEQKQATHQLQRHPNVSRDAPFQNALHFMEHQTQLRHGELSVGWHGQAQISIDHELMSRPGERPVEASWRSLRMNTRRLHGVQRLIRQRSVEAQPGKHRDGVPHPKAKQQPVLER